MLDAQGRIVIPSEQLEKVDGTMTENKIYIYFDSVKKSLILMLHPFDYGLSDCENIYYITTHTMNKKGRIFIPKVIREAFSNATYLPAEKNGRIYILIIEHEKKSE